VDDCEYASLATIWDTISANASLCYPVSVRGVFGVDLDPEHKDTLTRYDLQNSWCRDLMEPNREGA
jgi:hypothetical protein